MDPNHRQIIEDNLSMFIDKTKDITKVLNILRQKRVFNDPMANKILVGETDYKKKEIMYKMITKRGPKAFDALYECFVECGITELADILKPNRFHLQERNQRIRQDFFHINDPVVKSQERMDTNKTEAYNMGSRPKGRMLLINIKHFQYSEGKHRHGSDNDETNLQRLFADLGYEVDTYRDLKHNELMSKVKDFKNMEALKSADSVIIFVMTHGEQNETNSRAVDLLCHDELPVSSNQIFYEFRADNCPALKGKPKLFFFQACRGRLPDVISVTTDGSQVKYQNEADILIVYPCSPGRPSMRDPKDGAFFVQKLCQVFSRRAWNTDVITMLEEVNRELRNIYHVGLGIQVLNVETRNFNKKLYFNPGLYDSVD